MQPITVWTRFNPKTALWEHNHIEDGHVGGLLPIGTPEQTKAWKAGTWRQAHCHLCEYKVVQLEE